VKQISAFILAIVYLAFSSGVVLSIHYCKGKVTTVKLQNFEKQLCKCGSGKKVMHCCKNELKVLKIADDHQLTKAALGFASVAELPLQHFEISSFIIAEQTQYFALNIHAPPLLSESGVYLENCVFRI
jgi:hypothetical protein